MLSSNNFQEDNLFSKIYSNIWDNFSALMVHSHLPFIRRELLHDISVHTIAKWVHNPLLNYSVHAKVEKISGLNSAIETNTTQNYVNSTCNSSRLINRRCDSDSYDKSMRRTVKLVMSLKIKENSCKNEYFPTFGAYHFLVDFAHPEMLIVL